MERYITTKKNPTFKEGMELIRYINGTNKHYYIEFATNRKRKVQFSEKEIEIELEKGNITIVSNYNNYIIHAKVTPLKIINCVSKITGILPDVMKKRTRKREILTARQFVQYYMNRSERINMTLREIGIYTGNYDHATVMHSIKVIRNLINYNRVIEQQSIDIERLINE